MASHQHPSSPCFPSFLLSPSPSLNHRASAMHPSPPSHPSPTQSPLYPTCPVLCNHPTHPSLSLLRKLPVIDPGHIAVDFPLCVWEPQHPRPTLNEAPTKAHWWEAQCETGWPQPRAPRIGHRLPRGSPSTQRRPLWTETWKGTGEKERGKIQLKQLRECEIETKKRKKKQMHDCITYYSLPMSLMLSPPPPPRPPLLCILAGTVRLTLREMSVS